MTASQSAARLSGAGGREASAGLPGEASGLAAGAGLIPDQTSSKVIGAVVSVLAWQRYAGAGAGGCRR